MHNNSLKTKYCKILDVADDASFATIKKAYRTKVRQYHPDLHTNEYKMDNHLKMIILNRAYFYLKKHFFKIENKESVKPTFKFKQTKEHMKTPALHKDPGYVYYKQGFNLFTKIHPNAWYWSEKKGIFSKSINKKALPQVVANIEDLIDIFPRTYYFFSLVLEEYPDSVWCEDAGNKMKRIEKLTPMYYRILASYKKDLIKSKE